MAGVRCCLLGNDIAFRLGQEPILILRGHRKDVVDRKTYKMKNSDRTTKAHIGTVDMRKEPEQKDIARRKSFKIKNLN